MKKTIAILLATAGMTMAATEPDLKVYTNDNTEVSSYKFTSENIKATVVVNLNLAELLALKTDTPIFTLDGPHSGGETNASIGLGIDVASSDGTLYMDAWTSKGANYAVLDLPLESTKITEAEYGVVVFTLEQAASGTQVLVTESLFLYNENGEMLANGQYPSIPPNGKYATGFSSFANFNVTNNLIYEAHVYNSLLSEEDGYTSLANNMITSYINASNNSGSGSDTTVPEPTTATLSLLALAGLAARRRRK